MPFDFPNTPTIGATYTVAGITYVYDGVAWNVQSGPPVRTALRQNLLVNGAAQISQETAFATVITTAATYMADQWIVSFAGPTGNTNIQYITQPGTGNFPTSELRIVTGGTAYTTIAAGNYAGFTQYIEGLMLSQMLNWGRAEAIPAVLAFDAFCTVAGTYSVALRSSGSDRMIAFPITFGAGEANTWKRFTFPVPAMPTGTFARDNTLSLQLWFTVMAGSTFQAPAAGSWQNGSYIAGPGISNLLATTGAYLSVRKVSLHPDPDNTGVAPPAEMPNYADELIRCQRYWRTFGTSIAAYTVTGGDVQVSTPISPYMRVSPTTAILSAGAVSNAASVNIYPSVDRVNIQVTPSATGYCGIFNRSFSLNSRM